MTGILRATLSLDGKLMTASGKPRRRAIPKGRLEEVSELHLTILPILLGGVPVGLLSENSNVFLAKELRFQLMSLTLRNRRILARYRQDDRIR